MGDRSIGTGTPVPALATRAARGDRAAFGRLYEMHVDRVYNFVYFQVHDRAAAEDLTQDIFVRALRGMAGLKQPERFAAWLMRIAHHRVVDHWQAAGAGRLDLALDLDPEEGGEAGSEHPAHDPNEALLTRFSAEAVLAAAEGLTRLQRDVLALRFLAGLSIAETAAAMSRSENAVKNLQHHALAALRRRVGPREEGP
jgi:RNA polymerase sigma-70 factor (ECF subfamily)